MNRAWHRKCETPFSSLETCLRHSSKFGYFAHVKRWKNKITFCYAPALTRVDEIDLPLYLIAKPFSFSSTLLSPHFPNPERELELCERTVSCWLV